jgi:micrococcal nuclease
MRSFITLILFLIACTAESNEPPFPATFSGVVVGVTDGDTVEIQVDGITSNVRLEGIDSPESAQRFGNHARQALVAFVFGQSVTFQKTGEDRFHRTLGVILKDNISVNAKMIEGGFAWHYKEYNKDTTLADLERNARQQKRGLWTDHNPVAPWDYRKLNRTPLASKGTGEYWLNATSNVRHNSTCESFRNTKRGRICSKVEGRACGRCGG